VKNQKVVTQTIQKTWLKSIKKNNNLAKNFLPKLIIKKTDDLLCYWHNKSRLYKLIKIIKMPLYKIVSKKIKNRKSFVLYKAISKNIWELTSNIPIRNNNFL